MRRDLGDFQTPPDLVAAVLETLGPIGARWPRVLEPTCGRGHFLAGLLAHASPPREIRGIEIQPAHCLAAEGLLARRADRRTDAAVACADLFALDLRRDLSWSGTGPLLVVGNPPWVTSAELGGLAGAHVPPKSNVKGLEGLAARTGSANFDVAEAVWLKLARELAAEAPTIAMLCKLSVARGLLQHAHRAGIPIAGASIRRIDAPRWFGAAVEACWFCATMAGPGDWPPARLEDGVPVHADLGASEPASVLGFARGWLVADRESYRRVAFVDGTCPRTWRQGIKHDAAAVMELMIEPGSGRIRNRSDEPVEVEPEYVYPLIKGADLIRQAGDRPSRAVLVTQQRIGEDTARLATAAPRLWRYLSAHAGRFDRRRSSIYRGRPPFSMFGVGPYSFAPFKLAVSGLHKVPSFRAVGPRDDRPAMLDDTCYFLPCSSASEAAALAALCNDASTLDWVRSASFADAKRPVTKALLQRIDLRAVLERADRGQLRDRAAAALSEELGLDPSPDRLDRVEEALETIRSSTAGDDPDPAGTTRRIILT